MEELKFPEQPSHIQFTPPLTITRPLTLIVALQGHASVFLESGFQSSYQKLSTMKVKSESSDFSIQCGQVLYAGSQDHAFLYLRIGFNFPETMATELAAFLFSFNLKEVYIFDTLLSVQVYFSTASIFTLKTASIQESLDHWSTALPPSVMKQGTVAALLIKGEVKQKRILAISVKVQNRAIIELQELQSLVGAIVKLGGSEWALGKVENVSLRNKVCKELIKEHNSRGSGIYS